MEARSRTGRFAAIVAGREAGPGPGEKAVGRESREGTNSSHGRPGCIGGGSGAAVLLSLVWLVVGMLGVSCAARRSVAPGRAVITAYLKAVEADRPDQVYDMMDASYRKRVSRALFRKLWKTYRPELKAEAKGIRALLDHPGASKKRGLERAPLDLVAEGAASGKEPVVLVWHKGRWVIARGPGTELAGGGVRGALLMLVKVVEARDFSGFMALLSDKSREAFWRGVSDRLTKLKTWLSNAKIPVQGDRVRVYYDADSHVDLVREKGRWRIEDFN